MRENDKLTVARLSRRYRDQDLYPEEVRSVAGDRPLRLSDSVTLTTALPSVHQSDLTPSLLHSTFLSYLSEAHSLRETYSSKLSIPIGLETDFISSSDLVGLDQLLKDEWRRIDYLVGSVHHVSEIPIDFDRPTFDQALASFRPTRSSGDVDTDDRLAWTSLLGTYFDNQFELMVHYQPEVIGHFDLVRLWKPELKFADFEGVWDKVRRNVEFAVGYGALFELNAAAFRKGWDEAYPASDVLDVRFRPSHELLGWFELIRGWSFAS